MAAASSTPRITWDRVRAIFGSPEAPQTITERQFDGFDDDLARIARTPWERFQFSDLWYYHHDLAYSELQRDLFAYLFPVCLMDWQDTLLRNESCSHGDSEFHYGVRRGQVFEKMLTPTQRVQVFEFFRDGMLDRLDAERGFDCKGWHAPAHGWLYRMNSLGFVMPMAPVWDAWADLSSPGAAVAWLEYASGLMYGDGENPIFGEWTREAGGGGPYLWEDDSHIYDTGWPPENIQVLRDRLTPRAVANLLRRAVVRLRGSAEEETATRLEADLPSRMERVGYRCDELPRLLSSTGFVKGWTA